MHVESSTECSTPKLGITARTSFTERGTENASRIVSATRGWVRPNIHLSMLDDRARTKGFCDALRLMVQPEDVVVDIGTGTGVLATCAAKAGARQVYAVESSGIAEVAAQLAHHRGDRVAGEGHADLGVEAVHRLEQAELADLDEVVERLAAVVEAAGAVDRHPAVLFDQVVAQTAVTGVAEPSEARRHLGVSGTTGGRVRLVVVPGRKLSHRPSRCRACGPGR